MKIINCQTLGELCEFMLDREPCFLLRAQDMFSVPAVQFYMKHAEKNGGKNTIRTKDQLDKMVAWRTNNLLKVKIPD